MISWCLCFLIACCVLHVAYRRTQGTKGGAGAGRDEFSYFKLWHSECDSGIKDCKLTTKLLDMNVLPTLPAQKGGRWKNSWMGMEKARALICSHETKVIILKRQNTTAQFCSYYHAVHDNDWSSTNSKVEHTHINCDPPFLSTRTEELNEYSSSKTEWFEFVDDTLLSCDKLALRFIFEDAIVDNFEQSVKDVGCYRKRFGRY